MPCVSVSLPFQRPSGTNSCLSIPPTSYTNFEWRRRIGHNGAGRCRLLLPRPCTRLLFVFIAPSGSIPLATAPCVTCGTPLPPWVTMMCGLRTCPQGRHLWNPRLRRRRPRLLLSWTHPPCPSPSTIRPSVFLPPPRGTHSPPSHHSKCWRESDRYSPCFTSARHDLVAPRASTPRAGVARPPVPCPSSGLAWALGPGYH